MSDAISSMSCNNCYLAIFSFLGPKDLARCQQVSKQYQIIGINDSIWNKLVPECAFGKAKWNEYIGDIGEEPPLHRNIHRLLKSRCPIWSDHKVEDTHVLVLIPRAVNGKIFNLNALGRIVAAPRKGEATKFFSDWNRIATELGDAPSVASHWVLMTKDVLPGSRNKSFHVQADQVAQLARRTFFSYQVPDKLDVVTVLFMKYVSSGECILGASPATYTRCQDLVYGDRLACLAIGGFSPSFGLRALNFFVFNYKEIGMVALRKF